MRLRRLAVIIQAVAALCLSYDAVADASPASAERPRVDRGVHRTLKRQGTANIVVTMRDGTESVLKSLPHEASFPSRGAKITDMVEKLEAHAAESQSEITKLMAHESSVKLASEVKSFWITNQVFFRGATFELVEKLSGLAGIASIEEEPLPQARPQIEARNLTEAATDSEPGLWGISKIRAPLVWADGTTGKGVVVASIDSGVRTTHELLRGNYRKEFGWYDPEAQVAEPFDDRGHGTYTMGSFVGAKGVGVAPGVSWIACKNGRDPGGSLMMDNIACAQFVTCPTDPTGTIKDCSKAPRVVLCEFATVPPGGDTSFAKAISTWAAAGITAIFPTGNFGPACSTVGSPADNENMISIGASDSSDGLTSFSGRGPSYTGKIAVDITAPGLDVFSSSWDSDTSTTVNSGTSAAAPHVAGVVALMLEVQPNLTYDEIRNALRGSAVRTTLQPTGQKCGNTRDGVYPNNMYGYGRLDALGAVNRVRTPGRCSGLSATTCDGLFFCAWDAVANRCERW